MNIYRIKQITTDYSTRLEAYGVANFLYKIYDCLNRADEAKIRIINKGLYYEITLDLPLTEELLKEVPYFPPFSYIKTKIDEDISPYYDYINLPEQKEFKKERDKLLENAYKKSGEEKKELLKKIRNIFETEKRIHPSYQMIQQVADKNNISSFFKMYSNFHNNKQYFHIIISEILRKYSDENTNDKEFAKKIKGSDFSHKTTALQLYNPTMGKGLKKEKANAYSLSNNDSDWISETMKISGAMSDMICQLVKVGSGFDLKVFVPDYQNVSYRFKDDLIKNIQKNIIGNTPLKIDILNLLILTKTTIKGLGHSNRRRIKDIVSGLHSVYQKDLGQNKAVANISFLQTPAFVEIEDIDTEKEWINFFDTQIQIISGIEEQGDTISGLLLYRDFLSGSDIQVYLQFSFWYARYIAHVLSKPNRPFIKLQTTEELNKIYRIMDNKNLNFNEIITDDGFEAVATAIRKSTVTLQFTPKDNRNFDVRYGVAQALQNKSKSKKDLIEYIAEFIALYNSETARKAEIKAKNDNDKKPIYLRKMVRVDQLNKFYTLFDKYSAKLIGALLASYGFALDSKDAEEIENHKESDDTTTN